MIYLQSCISFILSVSMPVPERGLLPLNRQQVTDLRCRLPVSKKM